MVINASILVEKKVSGTALYLDALFSKIRKTT